MKIASDHLVRWLVLPLCGLMAFGAPASATAGAMAGTQAVAPAPVSGAPILPASGLQAVPWSGFQPALPAGIPTVSLSPAAGLALPQPAPAAALRAAPAAGAAPKAARQSPLKALLTNAPLAAGVARQQDLGSAREGARANFRKAAGLAEEGGAASAEPVPATQAPGAHPARLEPAPGRGSVSPAEQKVLEKIAKELGPVVEEHDAPTLYAELDALFGRLSAAQQKLVPEDVVSINRVYVVDTPVLNAFVYPMKKAGVRRSVNQVFVTTGLLRKMLDPDPALLREGLVRVAGVLAHELAHPLDNVDAEGILVNYGREMGGQAREVRADAEGAMLAKEAGYPVACVYESLHRLFAGEEDRGLVGALTGTHPQNDLRLGVQRMLLTLDRYEKGSALPKYPGAADESLLSELRGLDKGEREGRFVPLKGLADALERLKVLCDAKDDAPRKLVEFNRILLAMDALLARRKGELDDEEFRLFTEINRLAAKPRAPEVLDREGMNRLFTRESHSEEFLAYPSHRQFMKKVPAYRSPRYHEWVLANFFTAKKEVGYRDIERSLNGLEKILPADRLLELYGERIAADLPAEMRLHPNIRYIYDQSIAKGKSPEFQARLAVLFHDRVLSQLSEEERIVFFVDSTHEHYSYVFPQTRDGKEKGYSRGILKERGLLMGDPRLKGLQEEYRRVLRAFWDRRGYYGALDLLLAFNVTDWDAVFAVLDIDPQAGRSQLRQAVKRFARTPEYAAMLKVIRDSNLDAFRLLKLGHPMGHMAELSWLDDTLGPALGGKTNETLKADPELQTFAKQLFAGAYYEDRKELYRRHYRRELSAALAREGPALTLERLGRLHQEVTRGLVGGARVVASLADVQAEALDAAPLPREVKAALLRALFLKGHGEAERVASLTYDTAGAWLNDAAQPKAVLRVLTRNGVAAGAWDLFARLLADEDFRRKAKLGGYTSYVTAVSGFKDELLREFDAAVSAASSQEEKLAVLQRFAETAVDPGDGEYDPPELANTPELRDIKTRLSAVAAELSPDFPRGLALFRRLTGSGATPATDRYFQSGLEPAFDDAAAKAAGLPLEAILEKGRIASAGLQLSLARRVLEPGLRRMEGQPQDTGTLNRLIETLNAYVRQGSLKKDEFLESLAWRLDLSGRELGSFIEDEKSHNWRKANPILLRFGSALSGEIGRLSAGARREFIRFLIEPEGRELPAAILKELERNLFAAALALDAAKGEHRSKSTVKAESDRAAYLMKLEIEAALIDASPFERIPLFELLLSAGGRALQREEGFPANVSREFLGYAPDSTEEKMLAAFLEVVPAHERTVSLAYLLSQAGGDKTSVKNIFEVFQTVGVKFGQMSSTWKLFGSEVARETAALKNSARPMSKAEILEAARRELTPGEFARIKRLKEVIGSASLKTVVVVELADGREVVMMLRRPHAAEQIEANLRLGGDFLRELDRRGLSAASAMFDSVLAAVRRQLADEMLMTREAEQLRKGRRLYESLNRALGAELGGWRFAVPGLVDGFAIRDTILFMEKASGTTFDRLSPEDQAAAGPLIARSSLRLLFREGWFDADRHTGNQLIDARNKVIYPIDFGQAAEYSRKAFWKSDDRYELAQFLRALAEGDADALITHARAMAGVEPVRCLEALKTEVGRILRGDGGPAERLIALVTAFAQQGVRMDGRFTFGAIKGLMTLYGEGYVPVEGFRELLGREVTRLLKRKLPRTLLDR